MPKLCSHCGGKLYISGRRTRFCSTKCQSAEYRKKTGGASPTKGLGLNSSSVGTLHEMEVSCDLIRRGFHIFRAVCSSCPCDLAILRNGRLIRVEFTTGRLNAKTGKMNYPKHDPLRFDLLAVVTTAGILYDPDPSEL